MDFDQTKKIEVEVSENVIAENEVRLRPEKKKRFAALKGVDPLDIVLLPVILGVFVSLGFLFAGLFGHGTMVESVSEVGATIASVF